jgi:hypothetical protein
MFDVLFDLVSGVLSHLDMGTATLALFGIGGSKAKQSSTASSIQESRGVSSSESLSRSYAGSDQGLAFGDMFQSEILSKGFGAYNNANNAASEFRGRIDSLYDQGSSYLGMLGGDGYADEQVANLQSDLGRFFKEELLTGISRGATGNNTQGGGRQGIAEGLAAREVATQFQRGSTEIRSADLLRRQDAAKAGLAALPGLSELAGSEVDSHFAPLEEYAGLFATPQTTLTDSFSTTTAASQGKSVDTSYGASAASSRGKSMGFNIGVGV